MDSFIENKVYLNKLLEPCVVAVNTSTFYPFYFESIYHKFSYAFNKDGKFEESVDTSKDVVNILLKDFSGNILYITDKFDILEESGIIPNKYYDLSNNEICDIPSSGIYTIDSLKHLALNELSLKIANHIMNKYDRLHSSLNKKS